MSGHRFRILAKPAFVTFFISTLSSNARSTSISFILFAIHVLYFGNRKEQNEKKKRKRSKNRTLPLRPQDYPLTVSVARKWSRD